MIKRYYFHSSLISLLFLLLLLFILAGSRFLFEPGHVTTGIHHNHGEDEAVNCEQNDLYSQIYRYDSSQVCRPEEREKMIFEPEPIAVQPALTTDTEESSSGSGSSSRLNSKEKQMFDMINIARKDAGLPILRISSSLTASARAKSRDMANNDYFSHDSPRYGGLSELLKSFNISYSLAAENLAMNSSGCVSSAHAMLLNSTRHRGNILDPNFQYIGIGIQARSDGTHYYTQHFSRP